MAKDIFREMAERIAADLSGRVGAGTRIGERWNQIDPDVQEEILEDWTDIMTIVYRKRSTAEGLMVEN